MDGRPEYYRPLSFWDLAVHGDQAWFCNLTYSALFRMDLNSFEVELETFLPTDSMDEFGQYAAIAYFNNKLIIAPFNARDILIYDLSAKHIDKIALELDGVNEKDRSSLFTSIQIYRGAAFLLPGRYHAIVRVDLNTYEVRYMGPEKMIYLRNYIKQDGTCILPCYQNDNIVEIDLGTGEFTTFSLKCGKALSGVYYEDGIYWFACENEASVIRYDKLRESWSSVPMPLGLDLERGFFDLVNHGNYLYAVPFYGNMIVQIDKLTGHSTCFAEFKVMNFTPEMQGHGLPKWNVLCFRTINSHEAVLFSVLDGKILKLNFEEGGLREYEAVLSEKNESLPKEHMKILYLRNHPIFWEKEDIALPDLILSICANKAERSVSEDDIKCGSLIFDYVKNCLGEQE